MESGFVVRTEKGTWWLIRDGGELYETSYEPKASVFDSIDEGQSALDEIRIRHPERSYIDAKIERVGLGWNYRSGGWKLKTPKLKTPLKVELKTGKIVNGMYLFNDVHKKKYYHNPAMGIIPVDEIEAWRYWESSVDAPIPDEVKSGADSLEELSLENGTLKIISANLLGICNQLLDKVITGQREKETVYGHNSEAWKAIKAIEQSLKTVEILLGITEGE